MSTLTVVVLLFGYHTSTSSDDRGASTRGRRRRPGTTERHRRRRRHRLERHRPGAADGRSGHRATVTGDSSPTPAGARSRSQITVAGGKITDVTVVDYPNGNGKDQQINAQALPVLVAGDAGRPERDIDMVSGATVTSDGLPRVAAVRARPGRAVTRAGPDRRRARYVEHVMGMPISLALRGRHAADDAGRRRLGRVDGRRCATSTGSSAPTGADSVVSRLGRGELDPRRLPARGGRGARAGGAGAPELRRCVRRPPPRAGRRVVLDPSGVVKGWAAERAARPLGALPDTDFCLSAGGDMVCRTGPGGPAWRIGIEDPRAPRLVAVSRCATARWPPPAAPTAAHIVDARTGGPRRHRLGHRRADSLTGADIDATAAYALGCRRRALAGPRPGRSGLVVWADGSTTQVRDGAGLLPAGGLTGRVRRR